MILCIDTAISKCIVGLYHNDTIIEGVKSEISMRASEILHKMIEELLETHAVNFKDLQAIAINGGPGSYTGLRIGASSAKGFCYALDIPLIQVNCLELMLEGILHRRHQKDFEYFIPMIDARRDEVFTAVYNISGKELLPPQPMILAPNSFQKFEDSKCLFFGNGAEKTKELITTKPNYGFMDHEIDIADFKNPIRRKWELKEFEDVISYAPSYLKKFHTTASKA